MRIFGRNINMGRILKDPKVIIGLIGIIFGLFFGGKAVFLGCSRTTETDHIKGTSKETKELVIGIGNMENTLIDRILPRMDSDIENMKNALSLLTDEEKIDSLISLIRIRERERDEYKKYVKRLEKIKGIDDNKILTDSLYAITSEMDEFSKTNRNSDYYTKKVAEWETEEITRIKDAKAKAVSNAKSFENEIKNLQNQLRALNNENKSEMERLNKELKETIAKLNVTQEQLAAYKEIIKKFPPITINGLELFPSNTKSNKNREYQLNKIKNLKVTFSVTENISIEDDATTHTLELIYSVPTTEMPFNAVIRPPHYKSINTNSKKTTYSDEVTNNDIISSIDAGKQDKNSQPKLGKGKFSVEIRYKGKKIDEAHFVAK